MKIIIPGGSGQVGTFLARALLADGHRPIVLSRTKHDAPWPVIEWDGKTLGRWADEFDGADGVINLAGRSVNCRYHERNRRAIMDSRVDSTRVVGEAIRSVNRPPPVWLQASTATIYADRYDAPHTEREGYLGGNEPNVPETWNFSIEVAKRWEAVANEAAIVGTRLVLLRSAITLSPDPGGVFDVLLRLVRYGLGGRQGHGRQYVSWIHDRDFVRSIYWLIEHEGFSGPVNLAAPNPVTNAEFMKTLRAAWGSKIGLPAPRPLLEIGTFFMRSESELVLKSRRVVPELLLESEFEFEFPRWDEAAAELCRRWSQ